MRIRNEKLREHQYKEIYARSLENKRAYGMKAEMVSKCWRRWNEH